MDSQAGPERVHIDLVPGQNSPCTSLRLVYSGFRTKSVRFAHPQGQASIRRRFLYNMSTGILCSWLRLFIHRWNLQPLQGFAQRCTSVLRLLQALALSKEANVFFDGLVLSLCKRCTMVAHLTTILHALHGTSAPHLWSVQVYPQCIQPAYLRKVYHATASLAYTTSSVKILHVPCTGHTSYGLFAVSNGTVRRRTQPVWDRTIPLVGCTVHAGSTFTYHLGVFSCGGCKMPF